ncbi:gluconate 2-dehydrogenase subunit 3 family protein [Lewinella sp. JB7]|uniref:gluconate 2-dehydrogenase subunit 3 family protein n=1 Tax=Lewinella sp. JB7 TaxID=2962887 RepID=UPI0020C9F815|nr:gluconate 2-dehydrogenase subunit 3 family protein [Lewinella sp. JB7]MCP9236812.1 gluconate 2-dehydrogenase subunit 3 family protein [Lewinella sp. JB7]
MKRRELLRYTAYITGVAVSGPVASALLSGCKRDEAVAAGEAVYKPGFFNNDEYEYISKLADTMIPTTDTPGALDVGVPEMVDKMVGQVYDEESRDKFRNGLKELMRKMDADNTDAGFRSLDTDQALVYLQDQDLHYKNPDTDWDTLPEVEAGARNIYFDLKSQIVGAWFNSEPIGTEVLAYDPVPGEYIPCGDLQELTGGVAWAI